MIAALGHYIEKYKQDLKLDLSVKEFWQEYGYAGLHAHYPSDEPLYLKKRLQRIRPLMQCVECGKWRQLRFHPNLINDPPKVENWSCALNTDTAKQKY